MEEGSITEKKQRPALPVNTPEKQAAAMEIQAPAIRVQMPEPLRHTFYLSFDLY